MLLLCVCTPVGFQNHGRNFEAVAKLVVTKTVAQCKNFFFNYKRKYNLPKLVADYEVRNVSTCIGVQMYVVCALCMYLYACYNR